MSARIWVILPAVGVLMSCSPKPADRGEVRESATTERSPDPGDHAQMQDSARAYLEQVRRTFRGRDSAAYVAVYLPTGPIVSLGGGELVTSRDSVAAGVGRFFRRATAVDIVFPDPKIEVLGPDAAAIATPFVLMTTDSAGKQEEMRGAWSGVLAIREGRVRVLQEHQSNLPQRKRT